MAIEVKLPQLGQTMEEGTIVACKVKPGDQIKKGDVIFEIETDKATLEMESPAAGFVIRIVAQPGQTMPVGEVLLLLGAKDEKVDIASAKMPQPPASAPAPLAPAPAKKAPVAAPASANVVKLPQLGQTMEEGTIVSCKVKVGDEVKKGTVIFEVETDKATLEMESPAAGFVKHILVDAGRTLPVGEPLLVLGSRNEEIPQSFIDSLKSGTAPAAPSAAPAASAAQTTAAEPASPQPVTSTAKVIASPRAKKLAKDMGVDLAAITGTGPGGRITEQDVEKAAASKPAAPAGPKVPASEAKLGDIIPLNRLQRITAQKMLQSKREIPCFYLSVKVDVTNMVDFRTKLNETSDVKISYNDFIIKSVATGLEKFPIMTGQLDGDNIRLAAGIGIGLAISVPDGLVAPILKDVNKKTVARIARDSKVLIDKARSNKLAPDDLEGGCITVSNLGAFGIESFIPIVVPGQCSILGVGQITDTCVPGNGDIVTRKLMNMTLSVDHKVANGAYAAQFLDFVRKQLEDTSNFA